MSKQSLKDFVKGIGLSKSFQEECRIIESELRIVSQSEATLSDQELLQKILFLNMMTPCDYRWHNLGIECIVSKQLHSTRMGYILIANFTSPQEPIRMMLVNSILGDLRGGDVLRVQCALHGLSYLLNRETSLVFSRTIVELLTSSAPPVRRLAISAMQKANAVVQSSEIGEFAKLILSSVCDRDPSVMTTSLPYVLELIAKEAEILRNLNFTSCLVYILKQITEGRLSPSFHFYTIPAPWAQVACLKKFFFVNLSLGLFTKDFKHISGKGNARKW